MFTIDLARNTLEELKQKLQDKGIKDSDIDRFIQDTDAAKQMKNFPGTGRLKALVVITPRKSTLVLGVKVEVNNIITSARFPIAATERPFLLLSKGHSTEHSDSDSNYAHITNFQQWNPNPRISVITGRNGVGKTHLLKYLHHDLGGSDNDEVFFLDPKKSQEDFSSFLNGYKPNKHYVVQRAKYPFLALLSDCNRKTTTLDFENVESIDRYQYPHLQTLCQQVFGERASLGTKSIDKIEEKIRHLPREILEDNHQANSIILQHVVSSLPRGAEHARSFLSSILTCFYYLGKHHEFIDHFNQLLQQHFLHLTLQVTGKLENGLLQWQLRNSDNQLHRYDDLSTGEQALFNFLTWGISSNLNKLGETEVPYKVMLLDEPDGSLDPDFIKQMFAVLRSFADKGAQIIITTHRIDSVSLADEGSLFTIKDKAVIPSTRLNALLRMTKNTRELVNLQTTVYVEGKDVPFYSNVYLRLKAWCDDFRAYSLQKYIPELQELGTDDWRNRPLSMRYPLQFIQTPTKGGSVKEASCIEVRNGVLRGYHLATEQAKQPNSIIDPKLRSPFGIVDKDKGDTTTNDIRRNLVFKEFMVVPDHRYSKENFLFDPWIFFAVLSDEEINKEGDTDTKNLFLQLKLSLNRSYSKADRDNIFKEYYSKILGKKQSELTFRDFKVVYYQGHQFKTITYPIAEDFLEIPGHELEQKIFCRFKGQFKSAKILAQHITDNLVRITAIPQDLVAVFFRLNGKVMAHYNKFIKPPVVAASVSATAPTPTLALTTVVAHCHRVTYDTPLLNDGNGALLISAHKKGGMPLVNRLLDSDGSIRQDVVVIVTIEKTEPSSSTVPPSSNTKSGWFEGYWRKWQYRAEIKKLGEILKKRDIHLSVEQALASKLYRDELANIHPDKLNLQHDAKLYQEAVADAQFYKEFVEEFNNPYIQKTNSLHYCLHSGVITIRVTDSLIDGTRAFYDRSFNNLAKFASGTSYALAMIPKYNKATVVSSTLGVAQIIYQGFEVDYTETIKSFATLIFFTATPYLITALSPFPGVGQAVTGILITWSLYGTISNAQSLCLEHQDQDTVVNNMCSAFGYNDFIVEPIGEFKNSEL